MNFDQFLIVQDFNIHVLCDSPAVVKDALNCIDSFNLKQSVSGPMHEKGHTMDLVLPFGLKLKVSEIYDAHISDHFAVLFSITLPHSQVKPRALLQHIHTTDSLTASCFRVAFNQSALHTHNSYCHLSLRL